MSEWKRRSFRERDSLSKEREKKKRKTEKVSKREEKKKEENIGLKMKVNNE